MVYIHNSILFSNKNKGNPASATTWMDLEGIMLSEVSKTRREIVYDLSYMWNLENKTLKSQVHREDWWLAEAGHGQNGQRRSKGKCAMLGSSVMSDSLQPHGLYSLPGSSVHGDSPGMGIIVDSLPPEPSGKPLKVNTSSYKISPGDILYTIVTIINNILLYV